MQGTWQLLDGFFQLKQLQSIPLRLQFPLPQHEPASQSAQVPSPRADASPDKSSASLNTRTETVHVFISDRIRRI